MNRGATIEALLEMRCFYVVRIKGYLEDNWGDQFSLALYGRLGGEDLRA
jgi:hypothetical protein